MNEEIIEEVQENNVVYLKGKIVKPLEFSHESFNEKFYKTTIQIKRLSGDVDNLILVISEKELPTENKIEVDDLVKVEGQLRSYNYYIDNGNRRKLLLNIFVKTIEEISEEEFLEKENTNKVILTGHVCKKPIYRKTPFGREISDILLAVNRLYGKSDYLPCIAWGRNARFSENLEIGEVIKVEGRVQSRSYTKVLENDEKEERVAYEISIISLELVEEDKKDKEEETVEA